MAIAKLIPIRSLSRLANLIEYLENGDHSHHQLHRIHPMKTSGTLNAANFVERAAQAVDQINAKAGKPGRKLEIFAFYFVARFIVGTNLSQEERAYYDKGMIAALAEGGDILGVEHENLVLRASDFNYLAPSWIEYPLRARRTNEDDYARRVQGISNQLIQEMNVARGKKGVPPIVLARNRKLELARKRCGILIEEELAIIAEIKPVNLETLLPILAELGHTVVEQKFPKPANPVSHKG